MMDSGSTPRESSMEVEVGVLLLQSEEILEIEHLVQRACTIEVVHLAIGLEWRCGDTHGEHEDITLGRIVGH